MDLIARAIETLRQNPNAALATVCPDGRPWNSPIYCAFSPRLMFYWSSHIDAVHSANIAAKPSVMLVCFDSSAPDDSGHGFYVRATARELTQQAEIEAGLSCLAERKHEPVDAAADFMAPHHRRIYEAEPELIWTNVVRQENGRYFDEPVVIDIDRDHAFWIDSQS